MKEVPFFRCLAAAFLCVCIPLMAASHGFGQSQQAGGSRDVTTLHLTSRLVVVDVVVLDKAGRPVSNLDQSQFEVTENGVPQKISSFDPPSSHRMPDGSTGHPIVHGTADLAKIGNAPVDILVLDELNNSFQDAAYARAEMLKFLQKQPEVLPVPTQLIAAGESHFQVLHDHTQSRDELLESVKRYFPPLPVQRLDSTNLLIETLGILSQIAESTRGTPGRKNILWVGSGYAPINTTMLQPSLEDELQAVIRRVTDRMLDARVSLSMIDPKGVQVAGDGSSDYSDDDDPIAGIDNVTGPFTGTLDFGSFVKATGGQILANRNDVDAEIGRGADNSQAYYTLAYRPESNDEHPTAYRKIRVILKDRSLRAIARDGYFPEEEPIDPPPVASKPLPDQIKFDMLSAMRTRLPYNGLTVRAVETRSGYTLSITRRQLTWNTQPNGSRHAELTVTAAFFNARDRLLASKALELKQTDETKSEAGRPPEVQLALPLIAPPETARVRFVVRDAGSGVLGTCDFTQ